MRRRRTSKRSKRKRRLSKREWVRPALYGAAATAIFSATLFAAYKYVTREPSQAWFKHFVVRWQKQTDTITLWVPGVSTQVGYDKIIRRTLQKKGLSAANCPVAYFPYSSRVVSLDLMSALLDQLPGMDLRPQVLNIAMAITTFMLYFKHICIVCHSHGALLVKLALETVGARTRDRVRVNAFGPAVLVPERSPKYEVLYARNWVNRDDVLVKLGVLRLPPSVRFDDREQILEQDGCRYVLFARAAVDLASFQAWCSDTGLEPGGLGLGAHSCYPFQVGLFSDDHIGQDPVGGDGVPSLTMLGGPSGSTNSAAGI